MLSGDSFSRSKARRWEMDTLKEDGAFKLLHDAGTRFVGEVKKHLIFISV